VNTRREDWSIGNVTATLASLTVTAKTALGHGTRCVPYLILHGGISHYFEWLIIHSIPQLTINFHSRTSSTVQLRCTDFFGVTGSRVNLNFYLSSLLHISNKLHPLSYAISNWHLVLKLRKASYVIFNFKLISVTTMELARIG
jgi:hypothetical protein